MFIGFPNLFFSLANNSYYDTPNLFFKIICPVMAITGNSYASKLSGLYLDRWNLDWKWPQWKSGHQRFLLRFFLFSWALCPSAVRWSSQTPLQIASSVPLRLESVFSLCSFVIQIARKLFESKPIQWLKNGDKYYSKKTKQIKTSNSKISRITRRSVHLNWH